MKAKIITKPDKLSPVALHQGNMINIASGTYRMLADNIEECVQNALDAGAQNIWIMIDKRPRQRRIVISDNGRGTSLSMFNEVLQKVGETIKHEPGMLGRYGIGFWSFIGKCEIMYFTSTPKDSATSFRRWEFDAEKIAHQGNNIEIPSYPMKNMMYSNNAKKNVPRHQVVNFRTQIEILKYTPDKRLARLEINDLEERILDKYNVKMKELGTVVSIKIIDEKSNEQPKTFRARKFNGMPLDKTKYEGKKCGEVEFEMYLSPRRTRGQRKGVIQTGIKFDPFRLNINNWLLNTAVDDEVLNAFSSGIFEGEIIVKNCELEPDRKRYIDNDALLDFVSIIEKWYSEVGQKYVEEINDETKAEAWQESGTEALNHLAEIIKERPEYLDLIKSFKEGTTGSGHSKVKKTEKTEQDEISKRANRGSSNTSGKRDIITDEKEYNDINFPGERHIEDDIPFTVAGPKGSKRTIVKGHSTGLQIIFDSMPGRREICQFNKKNGQFTFNVRHPLWQQVEEKKSVLIAYIQYIIISYLTIAIMPENDQDLLDGYEEIKIESLIPFFAKIPSFGRQKIGKKKK